MNGRSVEEHIGRTIRELTPNVADRVEPIMRRAIETGEPHLGKWERRHQCGAEPRSSGTTHS